jgi:hypothetical protein
MYLSEETARQILNLNPNPDQDVIDKDIAERQFQVILNGFNHLVQPENNFLYIADEVGLGKTYIAIGIASLLRYFSDHPENYQDVIIVPKQNLQYKWQKEINLFIQKNYLPTDNIVKSILNKPAAHLSKESIKHQLTGFSGDYPNYSIYRNSSFSIASENDEESTKWMEKLKDNLPDYQKELFLRICKRFKRESIIIKRAYSYLLNHSIPNVDLLIVDEAHNFKHGTDDGVSIRNQIVARLFGANCDDEKLFEEFPELKDNIKPKVKKLMFLSATPINTQLFEIKRQLDCFLSDHHFNDIGDEKQTESFINSNLNRFMIRGLMTININQKPYSRNSYRHEHRLGNVEMDENAGPQYIKDNKTALVLSLMQYKTIKELKQKNNNQFEIGMLAGFESFKNMSSDYEDDTIDNKKENKAKDENVIRNVVESYEKEFSAYPPHPKQDSLVEEIFSLMLNRQKSLVFVRRITSVRELERKLLKKYSDHILGIIKSIPNYEKYTSLKKIIEKSELEKDREDIERIIDLLADRIKANVKADFYLFFNSELTPEQEIAADLRELFNVISENEEIEEFQKVIKKHVTRKNIDTSLKEIAISLLQKKWAKTLAIDDEDGEESSIDDEEFQEEKSPYFFQRFFNDDGRKFKKRMYTKDWFELNLVLVNEKYNLFTFNKKVLSKELEIFDEKVDFKRAFLLREQTILALRDTEKEDAEIRIEFKSNTFLSELLLELTNESFSKWIKAHKDLIEDGSYSAFINEIDTLNEILRSIFRQGSGFIPFFIAEALTSKLQDPKEKFINEMKRLLLGDFRFVLNEIEDILQDYDKIVERNFDNKFKIRYNLIQQLPVLGVSGQHKRDIRKTAIQFRMPGYPYVLIATDILKEGEDLHSYCKNIYHYGIAWNPSDMEQRTGRIDRIDSLAYRSIKKIDNQELIEIPFDSKLQVFYPYLADTLEVNQMCNLFSGMNKFIDIFYNDLSVRIEKRSTVNLDDLVERIIPQRIGLLESKYDINNFVGNLNLESELKLREFVGPDLVELQSKIAPIFDILKQHSSHLTLELDIKSLKIIGILNIRHGRQGPFVISIDQKKQLGQFQYIMESCLGRIQVFGSHSLKQKLDCILYKIEKKHKIKIEPVEKNSLIWLQTTVEIIDDPNETIQKLISLIHLTDKLESSLSQKDENVEINSWN